MKKLILVSLVLLGACGKQAALIKAPTQTFEKRTFAGFSADLQNKKFEEEARDITILMYPTTGDVENYQFAPSERYKTSWEDLQGQMSADYLARMNSNLPLSMAAESKVAEIVAWVNTAGGFRDKNFRLNVPLLDEKKENEKKIAAAEAQYNPAIEQALAGFSCFYKEKPRRGQKWDCRTANDGVYSTQKNPAKCSEMSSYKFVYPSPEVETQYQDMVTSCNTSVDALNAVRTALWDRNDQLDEEMRPINDRRDGLKFVVIDILESLEKVTGQVFISVASTLDKKLDCPDKVGAKCISKLQFGKDNKTIADLAIYTDFGSLAAEKLPVKEYSLANGGIRDLKFYTDTDNVKLLEFEMVTDLLKVKAKLSMTVQDDMALRFVGETNVDYKDGKKRRGVMKLEFNEVK